MGNSSSANKISAQDKAILDMKNQRDKLHQYQKRITVLTTREKEIAKECLARGDEKRAKLALRRKKYQESLLAQTDKQLATLEQLTSDVEFAQVQKDVLFGLQQGTAVLKEIHKEMGGIENVEKLLGESEEARAYQEVRTYILPLTYRMLSVLRMHPSRDSRGSISRSAHTSCPSRRDVQVRMHPRTWQLAYALSSSLLMYYKPQEISEMLANKMSNQDEDEVEDELEA
ncbi:hypothetical protein K491DRAFT_666951, partial [Lophiostoma macrostomum CBS 122681]